MIRNLASLSHRVARRFLTTESGAASPRVEYEQGIAEAENLLLNRRWGFEGHTWTQYKAILGRDSLARQFVSRVEDPSAGDNGAYADINIRGTTTPALLGACCDAGGRPGLDVGPHRWMPNRQWLESYNVAGVCDGFLEGHRPGDLREQAPSGLAVATDIGAAFAHSPRPAEALRVILGALDLGGELAIALRTDRTAIELEGRPTTFACWLGRVQGATVRQTDRGAFILTKTAEETSVPELRCMHWRLNGVRRFVESPTACV